MQGRAIGAAAGFWSGKKDATWTKAVLPALLGQHGPVLTFRFKDDAQWQTGSQKQRERFVLNRLHELHDAGAIDLTGGSERWGTALPEVAGAPAVVPTPHRLPEGCGMQEPAT